MSKRLPRNYIPISYDLYIHYSTVIYLLDATVTITFQKNEDSDKVILNASENITINEITQNDIPLKYSLQYPELTIFRSTNAGQDISSYPITIKYTVLPYENTTKRFYTFENSFLTSFEPNYTSTLLPCFDDPIVRSTFRVKIRIPSNLVGISNMPAEKTINIDDKEKEITFLPTPPMCCYLLSIFVGPFKKCVQSQTNRGIPVLIYSEDTDHLITGKFLLMAISTIEWFEEKMGVKYELPHLQFLSYKGIGLGMENYGLIALYDLGKVNENNNEFISNSLTLMHEISHMWFGDLVSIKWWDSIWLNEGFAQYFEYIALHNCLEQLENYAMDMFIKYDGFRCLKFFNFDKIACKESEFDFSQKALRSVHYIKGAFVLKMFSDIIGEENFFKICSIYLNSFKNTSVEISDFLKVAYDTLKEDYSKFFDPWLNEIGFPLINVVEMYNDDDQIIGIVVTQTSLSSQIYQFNLPILYEKDGKLEKMNVFIDKEETEIEVNFDWILVNDGFNSLCAVIYSKVLLEKLVNIKDKISKINAKVICESPTSINKEFEVDDDILQLCQEFSEEEPIYFTSTDINDENSDDDNINIEEEEENNDNNIEIED